MDEQTIREIVREEIAAHEERLKEKMRIVLNQILGIDLKWYPDVESVVDPSEHRPTGW